MKTAGLALAFAAIAGAQDFPVGSFHFVGLVVSASETRNGGGAMVFESGGSLRITGMAARNEETASPIETTGRWEADAKAQTVRVASPFRAGSAIELRWNNSRDMLIGTASDVAAGVHEILAAVAAGPPASGADSLSGSFAGGYFLVENGERSRLATGFVELTLGPGGAITKSKVTGHASWIDDVNRVEQRDGGRYEIAGGTGTLEFPAPSDILTGTRRAFVAASRNAILAHGAGPGERDILVLIRRHTEPARFHFSGDSYLFDLFAEGPYVFDPGAARFGSAAGIMRSSSNIPVQVRTRVDTGGRSTFVSTVNAIAVGSDGSAGLDTSYRPGLNNFAFDGAADSFAGAQVGFPGEFTLEHGIFAGFRMPFPAPGAVTLSPFAGPATPNGLLTLEGTGLGSVNAATLNGTAVPVVATTPATVTVHVPGQIASATASIEVRGVAGVSNTILVPVAAAAPVLVAAAHPDFAPITAAAPATGGGNILIFATGLGLRVDEGLQVIIGGQPAEISFAGMAPGFVGLYQLNVRVPPGVTGPRPVPLAIAATGAFSDSTDIPIR